MAGRVFWAIVSGFLLGVAAESIIPLGFAFAAFFVLLAIAALILWYSEGVARSAVVAVFCAACALGVFRMHLAVLPVDAELSARVGEKVALEGVVFEEPDVRENSTRMSVRTESGAGILVIAPLHAAILYGDRVRAEGVLRQPESFETGPIREPSASNGAGVGRTFDYPMYLAKDGIVYELSFAHVEKVGEGSQNPLKAGAIWVKQKYLEGLALSLPEPQAGLAGGITAGDKRGLGSELSETFRTVGLIHIVVLSGYNIMVVIGFIEWLFRRAPALVRFSLGIGVAIFFALMTGLASSSVRAASMAVIAMAGKATGRIYLAHRALALVAFFMVLWNPYILVFDPGFQLSVIATWGLLSISPLIERYLHLVTNRFNLREIAATTIGTQLAVLPLLLYQSGQLSLVALPANLLTLIVVPYAMLASFIAGLAGLFAGLLAPAAGFPAYALLAYVLSVATVASHVPLASVIVPAFNSWFLFGTYLLLGIAVYYRGKLESGSPVMHN